MVCYWFACSRMQRLLLLVALCLCALVRTDAAPWNSKNDPSPFFGDELGWRSPPYSLPSPSLLHSTHKQTTATHSKEPQRHNEVLHDLPRSGSVSHTHRPWSTYFLQFNKGGIAERFEANYRNFSDTCRESKAAASLQDHLTAIDLEFLDQVDLNNALCPAKHFYYTLHSKEELLRMTISDKLHLLSPAEKMDILRGDYKYPTVHANWDKYKSFTHENEYWRGLCHAWSMASICLPLSEPTSILLLQSKEGVFVPFSYFDMASLLTEEIDKQWDADEFHRLGRVQVGSKCTTDLMTHPELADTLLECWDVNPGSFHVILANYVGIQGRSFVADVARSKPVWQKPVESYTSDIVQTSREHYLQYSHAAPQEPTSGATIHRRDDHGDPLYFNRDSSRYTEMQQRVLEYYLVKTEVTFVVEVWPGPDVVAQQSRRITRTYEYILEVARSTGRVLGGVWVSWDRPDFVFTGSCGEVRAAIAANEGLNFLYEWFSGSLDHLIQNDELFSVKSKKESSKMHWKKTSTNYKGVTVYTSDGSSEKASADDTAASGTPPPVHRPKKDDTASNSKKVGVTHSPTTLDGLHRRMHSNTLRDPLVLSVLACGALVLLAYCVMRDGLEMAEGQDYQHHLLSDSASPGHLTSSDSPFPPKTERAVYGSFPPEEQERNQEATSASATASEKKKTFQQL